LDSMCTLMAYGRLKIQSSNLSPSGFKFGL